ncbi:MAG TPA: hypothetical protein VFO29_03440 [Candidatus Rubrimentiphilum sp.]|nr:hypothetical protein [Candidatus Rubrimentiphilum sp.]
MHTTIQRIGALTAMLVLAAGATALASINIEPSNSITLQPRGKGMNNSDPDRETVTITAVSHTGKVELTQNTCKGELADVADFKVGAVESSGSGRPNENDYYATIRLNTKKAEGSCVVVFNDGSHTATVRVRIARP